jgi:hypothetical protein
MNAGAAHPAPSDTTYKKVYQTFLIRVEGITLPKNAAI